MELLLSPVFVNIFSTYFAVVAVGVYDPFFEEGLPLECFDDIGLQVLIFSYLAGLLYLFFGSFVVCVGNDFFVVVDAFLWYWGEQYESGEGTEAREGYVGLSWGEYAVDVDNSFIEGETLAFMDGDCPSEA